MYSKKLSYHKYCFILYAPQFKKIVDVLDSRHKENLEEYFHNISLNERKNVQFFSIDLYDTYRAIGKKYFPNSIICADAFHVIKNLSSFLHKIRIRIMHKFENLKYSHDNYYWLLKRYPKLLTRDKSKLGYTKFKVNKQGQYMNEHEIVEYILSLDDQLKKAYDIYQEYLVSNQIATIDIAEQWLNQLIDDYKASNITEYVPAWKLLENWHDEIINSFNRVNGYRISNGPMERVNE